MSFDKNALRLPFESGFKPISEWALGVEAEKPGVFQDGQPLLYHASGESPKQSIARGVSVEGFFSFLETQHAWVLEGETKGGPSLAAIKGKASVTLEPAAQLELSGSPLIQISDIEKEFKEHFSLLESYFKGSGLSFLALGFHPFAKRADLPWVPKSRYAIMREYLPTRGVRALDMMQRTSTVQVNLDASGEADLMDKVSVASKAQLPLSAMLMNSPYKEGKHHGVYSERLATWLLMDPDRSGLLQCLWEAQGIDAYIEWALNAPMFLFKRDKTVIANTGQPFIHFMKEGFQGHQATEDDWAMHLQTLFPEVRIKKTMELRALDAQTHERTLAVPAFWKGLLYHRPSLAKAKLLLEPLTYDEGLRCQRDIPSQGLQAMLGNTPLHVWMGELLNLSLVGLKSTDETAYLDPLFELWEQQLSPAELMLKALGPEPSMDDVIRFASYPQ